MINVTQNAEEYLSELIEKKDFEISHTDHIRTLTLNLIGCERLEQLEVDAASASIQTMKVLDGSGSGKLSFHSDDADLDYLARVFSFNDLRDVLVKKVKDSMIIDEIVSYDASKSGIQANLSGGSILESNLLVIAEGRNSTFAKSIGAETFKKDYQQIAKTFLVEIPECKDEEAIQIFYEKEIFALMPYKSDSSAGQFSVVWSMPKEFAEEITANNISTHLQKFEKKLSCQIKVVSDLLSFPLSAHHLDEYCNQGVCVIADAAHSIHPLAGQGINLGISDAMIPVSYTHLTLPTSDLV